MRGILSEPAASKGTDHTCPPWRFTARRRAPGQGACARSMLSGRWMTGAHNGRRRLRQPPGKQAIDEYFADFIACYFPQAHQDIDWAAGYETLDKELPGLARDADLGQRYADKLVKVRTRQGQHDLVYVHIEVQGQHDPDFAQRMFVYHYRIFDRFGQPPVLWRCWPMSIRTGSQAAMAISVGDALEFAFPTVKLSEHTQSLDALLASDNPLPF